MPLALLARTVQPMTLAISSRRKPSVRLLSAVHREIIARCCAQIPRFEFPDVMQSLIRQAAGLPMLKTTMPQSPFALALQDEMLASPLHDMPMTLFSVD